MGALYETISSLCRKKGITGYRLCKDIGIQPSILSDLKSGRKKGLSAEYAEKIASYFGVSVGYLLGTEDAKKMPAEDGEHIPHERYRELLSQDGIRLLLDEDANVPEENLEDIIKYIKLRQRDTGR